MLVYMKPYSVDLRERIVDFVKKGGSRAEAAKHYQVSRWTVYRYLDLDGGATGSLAPKPQGGSKERFSSENLRREVAFHPDATLHELGAALGVSHVSVWKKLRRLGITLKKSRTLP
jgi:putative transposase